MTIRDVCEGVGAFGESSLSVVRSDDKLKADSTQKKGSTYIYIYLLVKIEDVALRFLGLFGSCS